MQIRVDRPNVLTYLCDASYALYLTHPLIVMPLLPFWRMFPASADVIILVSATACLLFSWRVSETIERPLLAALRNPRHKDRLKVIFGSM